MMEYALMGGGAVLFGFFASLLGIGGGLFIVPWLTIVFGLPIHQAIGASLVAIIANSSIASSVYLKKGYTDIELGLSFGLVTALGAIFGAFMAAYLHARVLSVLFGLVLVYAAGTMLWKRQAAENEESPSQTSYQLTNYPLGYGASFVSGNLAGLLGIGGGLIQVTLMHLTMGMPFKLASATSSFTLGITASAAAFLFYARGEVDLPVTASVVLGIFLGSYLGSLYLQHIKTKVLKPIFVVILLVTAVKMFYQGLGTKPF